jgi:uncharacterized protein YjbJ (UPF0337 family)
MPRSALARGRQESSRRRTEAVLFNETRQEKDGRFDGFDDMVQWSCKTLYERRSLMNTEQMKGQWMQVKGEIKKQWGKLTDDELDRIAGERDKLVGKLQEKYGITKEEAERQVRDFRMH